MLVSQKNNKLSLKCPLCHATQVISYSTNYKLFRHMDFSNIAHKLVLAECEHCQLIFNLLNDNILATSNLLFKSENYSESKQTQQTLLVSEFKHPVTRSFLQAEAISKILNKEKINILDIGCFDASLLQALDKKLKPALLCGFDVNPRLSLHFPNKNHYKFYSNNLSDIQGQFDLICLSHSLMYIQDLAQLMRQLKYKLSKNGLVFIQTPDINKNKLSILLGDQFYYFSQINLVNIFKYFGFKTQVIKNPWFPREVIITATVANKKPKQNIYSHQLPELLDNIDHTVNKLRQYHQHTNLYVLGTTLNAAFVDSILEHTIRCFIDENKHKLGTIFRNKKVKHPSELKSDDLLIIPYAKSSDKIKKEFEKKYQLQYLCV
ncbi:MAG: class I SAM-dependent methyltransferase [gamma proteobacterium symbiont of Taylorina sp.]|nr:class I SAM-dependent methyltransferase [gamma proteobacterium symbiont of Taylorina sp.]